MNEKPIIDVCCGGRAFYFDKNNPLVMFCDKRNDGSIELCNGQTITVSPNMVCDFKSLPFADETFYMVIFDPPHLIDKSETAWMVKKYGTLPKNWQSELKAGFAECWRVLKPNGTLIFKWNEAEVKTSEIIRLFEKRPVFGHPSGKRSQTQWLVYFKDSERKETK